jgi:adenylate cyclase
VQRKLAAILCADVSGYSRLMGADEEATLRTLSAYRKIIDSLIEGHRGRFVNSAGDSILAEFTSVVEAVNCAVEVQNALKAENSNLLPERRMEFRIGVNLGDVIVEGEQIYGDGVNVAARLESLADPGGICISGIVHDQVRDKLPLTYDDAGEQAVKNIARPVRVWRVLLDGTARARLQTRRIARRYWRGGVLSLAGLAIIVATIVLMQHISFKPPHTSASIPPPQKPALALPDKPSIAVLPFTNMSGDREQEYFSDGITDDLITDLLRVPKLFVIARTSSFTYKGKAEKAQSIGRELGVKYLLEGSARRVGSQVRINVQLADATLGDEIWSQRYDRQMSDIFKLQDEVVQSLVTTLHLQLSVLQKGIVVPQRTNNLEAYDYFLRGEESSFVQTRDALDNSRKMFQKAIALDPRYADAYAALAFVSLNEYLWQLTSDPDALDRDEQLARKGVFLDNSNSTAYAVLGWVLFYRNRPAEGIAQAKQALVLDPNNSLADTGLAEMLNYNGRPEEALVYSQKAIRLDPNLREYYALQIGNSYNQMGRYRQAVEVLKAGAPNNPWVHAGLIYAYTELGREADAQAEGKEVLRLAPTFSLEEAKKRLPLH